MTSWEDLWAEPAARPAVAGPVAAPGAASAYAEAALAAEADRVRSAANGTRNHVLNTAAFSLGQLVGAGHVGEADVRQHLMAAAAAAGLGRGEAFRTIESGLKGGARVPRVVPEPSGGVLPPRVLEVDAAELAGDVDGVPLVSSWAPVDLGPILDGTHRPAEPVLLPRTDGQGLLYSGLTHSLHGESESGKSLLAQAEAARVLTGGGAVLFIDFESDASSVVGRLLAMGADKTAIRDRFTYLHPEVSPQSSAFEAATWREVLARPFDLAVVDGVTESLAVFGGSTKDNDDVTRWARVLPGRIAAATGAAVVVVDHVVKDSDSRGRFAIGGQAKMAVLTGAAFTIEIVEPLGLGLRGVLSLRVAKDRPGRIRPHCGPWRARDRTQEAARVIIDSTGPQTRVLVEAPEQAGAVSGAAAASWRPTVLMERVSCYLEGAGASSFNAITESVSGKRANVRAAVDVLIAEGHVVVTPGPRGAQVHESVAVFRAAADGGNQSAAANGSLTGTTGSRSIDPGTGNQSFSGSREPVGTSGEPVVCEGCANANCEAFGTCVEAD